MDWQQTITGIGQDSHAFSADDRPLILGGIKIPDYPGLAGNSDADVVLHAICNAITSITGEPWLGPVTDRLCQQGITDSAEYLTRQLDQSAISIVHTAISIEARRPRLLPWITPMRQRIAVLTRSDLTQVGITATSGEALSACGRGEGIYASVILTATHNRDTPLLVTTTCPDQITADRMAHGLVNHALAACVQQLAITSTYSWEEKLHQQGEILLLIKTRHSCYDRLAAWIAAHHPYDTPQIIALHITDGLPSYLAWLVAQTKQ